MKTTLHVRGAKENKMQKSYSFSEADQKLDSIQFRTHDSICDDVPVGQQQHPDVMSDFSDERSIEKQRMSILRNNLEPRTDYSETETDISYKNSSVELKSLLKSKTEGNYPINCSYSKPDILFMKAKHYEIAEVSFSQTSSDQESELHEMVSDIISDLSNEKEVCSTKENSVPSSHDQESNVSGMPPDGDTDVSTPLSVLKDVTAFVEVRTKFENTSRSVEKRLLLLGAQVSKRLNKKVTHVVFMNGRLSTQKKGISQGCHMVSVLWVETCRQKNARVPEHLFPATLHEEDDDPLFPKRHKRFRCIEPKKFKEVFVASTERLKDIFSRVNTLDSHENPLTSTPIFASDHHEGEKERESQKFILDTEAFNEDKEHSKKKIPKRELFSNHIPLENSPVSNRKSRKSRLFQIERSSRKYHVENHGCKNTTFVPPFKGARRMSKTNAAEFIGYQNADVLSKENNCMQTASTVGKETMSDYVNFNKEMCVDDNKNPFNKTINKKTNELNSRTNKKLHTLKRKSDEQLLRKAVKKQVRNSGTGKNVSSKESSVTDEKYNKEITFPFLVDSEQFENDRNFSKHYNNSSNSSCKVLRRRNNVTKNIMTKNQQNIVPPKIFQDQENIQKNHISSADHVSHCKISRIENEYVNLQMQFGKASNYLDKQEEIPKTSVYEFQNVENEGRCCVPKKLKATISRPPKKSLTRTKTLGRIVITNVPEREEESIRSIVKSLGSYIICESVTGSITHVICGERKRTLKVIFGIVLGCWLVSPQWVFKSLEAGRWLKEEPFELAEYFPGIQLSRLEHQTIGDCYKKKLFHDLGLIYISPHCVPTCKKLTELVTMAGGKVTKSLKRCAIIVGSGVKEVVGARFVTEKWIFDCITSNRIIPISS